uniref:NEP1-interacting protein 1 n=1 Tax=Ananas comosus var. bracteatus TaxID=296719 RepID=A0A6V7QP82_ANACO|nr:unnamed protein product [Ananas comosus var. bracteatus]
MDSYTSSSSSSSSSFDEWVRRGSGSYGAMASQVAGRVLCATITCIFAIVGSFVGAVTGALIGLATESGMFRGAGIGAISGAVFSIEVVESSLDLWKSNESGIWSILYVSSEWATCKEKVGPAVQSAVQSQMSALGSSYMEVPDFFETGGTRGVSKDSIDNIPKIRITTEIKSTKRERTSAVLYASRISKLERL